MHLAPLICLFFLVGNSETFHLPNSLWTLIDQLGTEIVNTVRQSAFAVGHTVGETVKATDQLLSNLTQDLLHHGDRLRVLSDLFGKQNFTAYREKHKNVGLLQELIPNIEFTSVLNDTDPIAKNIESGLAEYLFQGDIVLSDRQFDEIEISLADEEVDSSISMRRAKRQITKIYNKWANNTLFYTIEPEIDDETRLSIVDAIKYIESRTCIRFENNAEAKNRVKIFKGVGCYASVGMLGGEQTLSLGDGCSVIGTVAHELTHALGIWHTQMRADRDQHVTIDLDNIDDNMEMNFAKLTTNEEKSLTPYEYGSFLHYSANSFASPSTQGYSIVPNDLDYIFTLGNRMISFYDMLMLNIHYSCDKVCDSSTSIVCTNGGYPNPNDCSKCVCPLGYGGIACNERPNDGTCGSILEATPEWQKIKIEIGEETNVLRYDFTVCTTWIKTPPGTKIETKIMNIANHQCQISCPFNGIEIKRMPDIKTTSPRFCCPEFYNRTFTSLNNPTPVVVYNRFYISKFFIQYRAVPLEENEEIQTADML